MKNYLNIMHLSNRLRTSGIITLSSILLFAAACKKKNNDVTGCMDVKATNYNSAATINGGCHYLVDDVAGNYLVTDTTVTFHHDPTIGWFDTTVTTFTLHVNAYNHDSIDFNDNGLCLQCHRGLSYFNLATDFRSYNWAYDAYYYYKTGNGTFSGNTFRYSETMSPMSVEGATSRWGTGCKPVY